MIVVGRTAREAAPDEYLTQSGEWTADLGQAEDHPDRYTAAADALAHSEADPVGRCHWVKDTAMGQTRFPMLRPGFTSQEA